MENKQRAKRTGTLWDFVFGGYDITRENITLDLTNTPDIIGPSIGNLSEDEADESEPEADEDTEVSEED